MIAPWVGLSLMLEDDFRDAATPLFVDGVVETLEWSFDTGWKRAIPAWADALLDHYGSAARLLGHGVHYSPFSARWEDRQTQWLERLAREVESRQYVHLSEHYGFMTAAPYVRGAPLPVPRGEASRRIGQDRLARMREVAGVPVGLENLALAWNRDEALAHGSFLGEVVGPSDGFVVLDVHNAYCQAANFDITHEALLASFPVDLVREIHVSGGSVLPSWPGSEDKARCDTHDDRVPEPVYDLLRLALRRFPAVRAVIFERLGGTLRSSDDAACFRDDYRRIAEIVQEERR